MTEPLCEDCGQAEAQIHVHIHYVNEKGRDDRPVEWRALCLNCHERLRAWSVKAWSEYAEAMDFYHDSRRS